MIITFFMALAVLFGALVLLCLYVGRQYELRHKVGEIDEEMEANEHQFASKETESNSEENL